MFEYMRLAVPFSLVGSGTVTIDVLVGFLWPKILVENINQENFEIIAVETPKASTRKSVATLGRATVIQTFFLEMPVNMMADYCIPEFDRPWS